MLEDLKEKVLQANLDLVRHGLVILTFGNVSGIDRASGLMAIKPSGMSYEGMAAEDIVLVDAEGKPVQSRLQPSSDTPTHLALYEAFPEIGGIAHAHSIEATAFAQARLEIPCLGTTHADQTAGEIPCTAMIGAQALAKDYELGTGELIVETFRGRKPLEIPMVIVAGHGPFAWGKSAMNAVHYAAALEEVARMAILTYQVNPSAGPLPEHVVRKHYERKHGPGAYYGQPK